VLHGCPGQARRKGNCSGLSGPQKIIGNVCAVPSSHATFLSRPAENVMQRSGFRPSVCLSRRHTHRDSPGGRMRRGWRMFRSVLLMTYLKALTIIV